MRRYWMLSLYAAAFASICAVAVQSATTHHGSAGAGKAKTTVRVLTIGGSVSHGWDDTSGGGFLHRTFTALSGSTNVTYKVYDKTIVGANAVQLQQTLYKGDYEKWLGWFQPDVVVIAWGLLNDCLPKTPMSSFKQYVGQEINEALARNATVYVVTPPVTRASYTQYERSEQAYVNAESNLVRSLHNPNVQLYDVYDEMKQYLKVHRQTYAPYMANGWHPNSAGHALAAKLLTADIQQSSTG